MASPSTPGYRVDRAVVVVGVLWLVDTAVMLWSPPEGGPAVGVTVVLLALLSCLSLALRAAWPVPVAVVTLLAAGVYYPLSTVDGGTPMVAAVVALYAAARAGHPLWAAALATLAILATGYGEFATGDDERNVDNMAMMLLGGWLLGVVAVGHAARTAERERDLRARQSATEERLRLARELHDVLGHHVSLINVQASAALHRAAKRPGQTEELTTALEFVRDTSKESLRELRATLGVLRQVDEEAPTEPAGGLARIGELAERAERAGGPRVTVETGGTPPVVPPQVSLAAYRIVQESLTNVTRHARATTATVRVEYAPGELRVRVEDDGRGAPRGARGSGVAGMAERARALGGSLTAENTETGFRVDARLPLPERPEPEAEPEAGPGPEPGAGPSAGREPGDGR